MDGKVWADQFESNLIYPFIDCIKMANEQWIDQVSQLVGSEWVVFWIGGSAVDGGVRGWSTVRCTVGVR